MADGLLTVAWLGGVVVGVLAISIIAFVPELFRSKLIATTCPSCGYDMKGLNPNATCPECGKHFVAGSMLDRRPSRAALVVAFVFPLLSIILVGVMLAPGISHIVGVAFFLLFHMPAMLTSVVVATLLVFRGLSALSIAFSATANVLYCCAYFLFLRFGVDHRDAQSGIAVLFLPVLVGPVLGYALFISGVAYKIAIRMSDSKTG